jgi:predicted TIM-barrel fold metal-dependent hydrolase
MEYIGEDKAVLQNAHVYSELNECLGECFRRYPDRLIALATVNEWEADQPAEIERLRYAVENLGLRGLYFHTEAFFMNDWRDTILHARFDGFWQEVQRLGLPVFWDTWNSRMHSAQDYLAEAARLARWAERYPKVVSVFTHGLTVEFFPHDDRHASIPDEIWAALGQPNVYLELLLANEMGPSGTTHSRLRGTCCGSSTASSGPIRWSGVPTCRQWGRATPTANRSTTCAVTVISSRRTTWA